MKPCSEPLIPFTTLLTDPEFDPEPRSRKSLHFTPHAKQKQPPANLNDSFPTPLDSPTDKSSADNQDGEAGRKSKKRLQSDMYGNVSADEEEEESLPDISMYILYFMLIHFKSNIV